MPWVATSRAARSFAYMAELQAAPSDEIKLMGMAIRAMRLARGLSQQQAAERLAVTRNAWQLYESGQRQVVLRADYQQRLATALGGDVEELMLHRAKLGARTIRQVRPQAGFQDGLAAMAQRHDVRTATFPLTEGEVTLTYPASMTAESFAQLEQYLEIFIRANRPPPN